MINGCVQTAPEIPRAAGVDDFVFEGYNFGPHTDPLFRQGVKDGCRTADGTYTKNHEEYNKDGAYQVGWNDGRLKCTGAGE